MYIFLFKKGQTHKGLNVQLSTLPSCLLCDIILPHYKVRAQVAVRQLIFTSFLRALFECKINSHRTDVVKKALIVREQILTNVDFIVKKSSYEPDF